MSPNSREKEIEKVLVNGVKKLGGRAYKWVSPGNDGVPDRIVFLPGSRPAFVELKTEKGKLSALQEVQIKRLRDLGQCVQVIKGMTEVKAFLAGCEDRLALQAYWEEQQLYEGDDDA